ncbi:hypothetical protein [Phytomonospora endophytica]|uniref:Prenyltransferase n=1 Tax=Phytomonospora endophytica TaxID=714109 RepID=A0A841FP26_9ACTN|nr:hypothetical protein [Phytomonospora endophytica]MBB6034339.1 hypothetical protein [Phytomonospora endophytica]GIG66732.1 hypothetical protein Pen01_30270 [Phytomonospora endophytica]
MTASRAAAERFLHAEARLIERRLFETHFQGGPPSAVADALRGYQNPDGGFGHGLEPDTRCPASLPIYTEVALRTLAEAGAEAPELIGRACDHLARVADEEGAVPLAFPVIEDYPRADHWSEWTYAPDVNPTAGLAGQLYRLGVEHPWLDKAADYTRRRLDAPPPDGVHSIWELLIFCEHAPDVAPGRAETLLDHLRNQDMFHLDPETPGYGLSPLDIAPSPDSAWHEAFTDAQIGGHLDALAAGQQADGGWPITWTAPSEAALLEWRGVVTLNALRVLDAYGRL